MASTCAHEDDECSPCSSISSCDDPTSSSLSGDKPTVTVDSINNALKNNAFLHHLGLIRVPWSVRVNQQNTNVEDCTQSLPDIVTSNTPPLSPEMSNPFSAINTKPMISDTDQVRELPCNAQHVLIEQREEQNRLMDHKEVPVERDSLYGKARPSEVPVERDSLYGKARPSVSRIKKQVSFSESLPKELPTRKPSQPSYSSSFMEYIGSDEGEDDSYSQQNVLDYLSSEDIPKHTEQVPEQSFVTETDHHSDPSNVHDKKRRLSSKGQSRQRMFKSSGYGTGDSKDQPDNDNHSDSNDDNALVDTNGCTDQIDDTEDDVFSKDSLEMSRELRQDNVAMANGSCDQCVEQACDLSSHQDRSRSVFRPYPIYSAPKTPLGFPDQQVAIVAPELDPLSPVCVSLDQNQPLCSELDVNQPIIIRQGVETETKAGLALGLKPPASLPTYLNPQDKPVCRHAEAKKCTSDINDINMKALKNLNILNLLDNVDIPEEKKAALLAKCHWGASDSESPTTPARLKRSNSSPGFYSPHHAITKCSSYFFRETCMCAATNMDGLGEISDEADLQYQLVRASICYDKHCDDSMCSLGKDYLHKVDLCLKEDGALTREDHHVLHALYDHSTCCCEMSCSVQYCFFFTSCASGAVYQEAVSLLKSSMSNPQTKFTFHDKKQTIALNGQCQMAFVGEGLDWHPVTPLPRGKFGKIILALGKKLWAIKKWYKREPCDVDVIKYLSHPNIVNFLWAQYAHNTLYVCSEFETGCLKENLDCFAAMHICMPVYHVLDILHQVLSAAIYLHYRNIIYLSWTSSNISVNERGTLKLSNFNCAMYHQSQWHNAVINADKVEDMVLSLPWQIIPPELMQRLEPHIVNDSYGIGCLLHEVLTNGQMVHHAKRHQDPEKMRKQVREGTLAAIEIPQNAYLHGFHYFLTDCFKEFSKRKSAIELNTWFVNM